MRLLTLATDGATHVVLELPREKAASDGEQVVRVVVTRHGAIYLGDNGSIRVEEPRP